MPAGGFYFDAIIRQEPIDEDRLSPEDNCEEFVPASEADAAYFGAEAERLYTETDQAIIAGFGNTGFGDIALVPGTGPKHPKGLRDVEEWYVSTVIRRDYVWKVFERQCEVGLANLAAPSPGRRGARRRAAGHRHGFWCSARPLHLTANVSRPLLPLPQSRQRLDSHPHHLEDLHAHLRRRGPLLEDFIAAGFDILNPVQVSAVGMEATELKRRFGDRITFWGGGVDTQRVLPFGTPEEVRVEGARRIREIRPAWRVRLRRRA